MLDFAPLHGISATAAGTGKSFWSISASILVTGHDAPVVSIDTCREEAEKRLGASLLAGDALVAFDNCNSPVTAR